MISVRTEGIRKVFGHITAVSELSFTVSKGELFGFIGPDGAGKTTLFRMLTTLLVPDGGSASVLGFDLVRDFKKIRKNLGYMPGRFSLYHDLTVEENLSFYATVFGTKVKDNYHLIRDIYSQIEPFKNRKAGNLSGGMKQKLALSCALIHKPDILFLDEPTTGVDAVSRKEFWEMLKRLKANGITILVSTPYMDEATLCDRIALMQNGEVMTISPPDEVIRRFSRKLFSVRSADLYRLLLDLREHSGIHSVYAFGQSLHMTMKDDGFPQDELLDFYMKKGHSDLNIKMIQPVIEDCFMELMMKRKTDIYAH